LTIDDDKNHIAENFHEANNVDHSAIKNCANKNLVAGPNVGTGDPTDGRQPYNWTSCYPPFARKEIRCEAFYLFTLLLFSLISSCLGCIDVAVPFFNNESLKINKFLLYVLSGLLGGSVFGIKFFYRVVARGYWHQDRRFWRLFSPLMAMTVALVIGAMIDSSFLSTTKTLSSTAIVSIGFLSGYFADDAVGKMYEIANVLFGRSSSTKAGDDKQTK
jgi:hypothetical protein